MRKNKYVEFHPMGNAGIMATLMMSLQDVQEVYAERTESDEFRCTSCDEFFNNGISWEDGGCCYQCFLKSYTPTKNGCTVFLSYDPEKFDYNDDELCKKIEDVIEEKIKSLSKVWVKRYAF